MQKTKVELIAQRTVLPQTTEASPRLPLWSESTYIELLKELERDPAWRSHAGVSGGDAKVVDRLRAPYKLHDLYSNELFWEYYLGSEDESQYWKNGWTHFLPLVVSFKQRLEVRPHEGCKVSMKPQAFLFPTGWTISLSLQITGQHDQHTLSNLLALIFHTSDAITWPGDEQLSLRRTLGRLDRGIQEDVFGGAAVTVKTRSPAVMTTVLDSGRDHWSREAALYQDKEAVARIVKPRGPLLDVTKACAVIRSNDPETNFIIVDDDGFFLWFQQLLLSANPHDRVKLACYHNNTVRALVIHRQERQLLEVMHNERCEDERIKPLASYAWQNLSRHKPPYKNMVLEARRSDESLRQLLDSTVGLR